MSLEIAVDDPHAHDVSAMLEHHLAFARAVTPPEDVHALEVGGLAAPGITLFSARRGGDLMGVAALREMDPAHGEIKSMHTRLASRGQGVARALVEHLLHVAARRGYRRVSLETGTMDSFAPARALYASIGFAACEPFGEYTVSPNSVCMTIDLGRG